MPKKIQLGHAALSFIQGDITKESVDAIVNAANQTLMGGGGVDGAIHRAGGPAILDACKKIIAKIGRLPTGEAVITTGGNLPARFVIHTVGPVWSGGGRGEAEFLKNCYVHSLQIAEEKGLTSIAFPSISTGAYRYPVAEAAAIAVGTVKEFLLRAAILCDVRFVLFDPATYEIYAGSID